ncbi:MAG: peptidoglycan bridge formation glycyltransferase FemA/FemB family protein [bacterium]
MKLFPEQQLTQEVWDAALLVRPDCHFLQSWAWGEFQKTLGNPIWRLAVEDGGEIVNQLLVINLRLGWGWSLLYSPRGNLVNKNASAQAQQVSGKLLLDKIRAIADKDKSLILFRVDPNTPTPDTITATLYKSLGLTLNPKKNIQPKHSLVIDLTLSETVLMEQMKQKTRYNINLGARHGVEIHRARDEHDIKIFAELIRTTSARNQFSAHGGHYYETQFKILHPAGIQDLFIASTGNEPLAGILVNTFGDTATYTHGASANHHRNLMAPHLLQFTAMITAKDKGVKHYDMWGIHPDPNHPWAGITRFKQGFGGREVVYLGTFELPLRSFAYKLYTFVNQFRR